MLWLKWTGRQDMPLPERPVLSSAAGERHTDTEKPGPLAQTQGFPSGRGGHPTASLRSEPNFR